mgnify:CR=1 FL=1
MGAVDGDMRDAQIVILGRVAGIDLIEFRRRVVGSARSLIALMGLIGGGGGDERDAALTQRFGERREGHIRIMRPAIGRAIAERRIIIADPHQIGNGRIERLGEAEVLLLLACSIRSGHVRSLPL